MSERRAATDGATGRRAPFSVPPGVLGPEAPQLAYDEIQALVDRAANHHFFTFPEPGAVEAIRAPGGGDVVGFAAEQPVHLFDIEMEPPSAGGLRATNVVGSRVGKLAVRFLFLPWDFRARPDREPPPTALDRARSQRVALQAMALTLDWGAGFESFGAGRTFPLSFGGRPQLSFAAVGNLTRGFGRYHGIDGNCTLCGELVPELGFRGHLMLRLVDPTGELREAMRGLPAAAVLPDPDPGVTYLTYLARKGGRTKAANRFSGQPDGTPRGVNIPVDLQSARLRGAEIEVGPVIGREIGFGRETKPRSALSGTALDPFQFEGVSEYAFHGAGGETVATFAANFLEGRTFAMELAGARGIPALRFGYYGVITGGTGVLAGLQGFLYGTAGSVFLPPPAEHVISNLYVARVADPGGRLRSPARPGPAPGARKAAER